MKVWSPLGAHLLIHILLTTPPEMAGGWITRNNNRFCGPNWKIVRDAKGMVVTSPVAAKYPHDKDFEADPVQAIVKTNAAANRTSEDDPDPTPLDKLAYRANEFPTQSPCFTYPLTFSYTAKCPKLPNPTVPAVPSEKETERCRIFDPDIPNFAELMPSPELLVLNEYTECKFTVDFLQTDDMAKGFKLLETYASDAQQVIVEDKLKDPDTDQYFEKVQVKESTGFYGFPYFLVLRANCEDEGLYGEELYNIAIQGRTVSVQLFYLPPTSRALHENGVRIRFEAVLVNLLQDKDKEIVPNPVIKRMKESDGKHDLCHLNLCFPAFVLPLPFLQVPLFQVIFEENRAISRMQRMIYHHPYHKRISGGVGFGKLEIAENFYRYNQHEDHHQRTYTQTTLVSARYFFPKERWSKDDNLEKGNAGPSYCFLSEHEKIMGEIEIPSSFLFEGKEEMRKWVMEEIDTYRSFLPLTSEDFFLPQYTFGTAPTVAIAGFYRPDLVLFGNPDMNERLHLVKWNFNQKKENDKLVFFPNPDDPPGPGANNHAECLSLQPVIRDKFQPSIRYYKPMYAEDGFGRRQYYPMDYASQDTRAIFEIISLEDRLLLTTAGGLVVLFGQSNATIANDISWRAKRTQVVYRCFKFVRVLKRALMAADPLVAVTHTYKEKYSGKERDQEIWFGKLKGQGTPIEWTEVGTTEFNPQNKDLGPEHISPAISNIAESGNIPEAAKICKIVFDKHVTTIFESGKLDSIVEFDWKNKEYECKILDGTPVPTRPQNIQLLLRMTFKYYKNKDCKIPPPPPTVNTCRTPINVHQCMRNLYCKSLLKTNIQKKPSKELTDYFDLVEMPKCVQNFDQLLLGVYDKPLAEKESILFSAGTPTDPIKNPVVDLGLCNTSRTTEPCAFDVQIIPLYIIAEHQVGIVINSGEPWELVGIFPERPCVMPHFGNYDQRRSSILTEAIRNVMLFGPSYFGIGKQLSGDLTPGETCFEHGQEGIDGDLQITRFTYTRQINNHVYFYGSNLLHSVDGGKSITYLRDFPPRPSGFNSLDYDAIRIRRLHVIKMMAFGKYHWGSNAEFAFLTSKRELWLGNSGSIRQVRLRPSPGWSMINLNIFKDRYGMMQAVPFSVMFDTFDNLFELVVLRDIEGHAHEVLKRPVNVQLIMRNDHMVEALHIVTNTEIVRMKDRLEAAPPPPVTSIPFDTHELSWTESGVNITVQVKYNRMSCMEWNTCLYVKFAIEDLILYCPYSQMAVFQNYSKTLNRLQQFSFMPPIQHPKLGMDYQLQALMAYQAGTFALVYDAFLRKIPKADDFYSHMSRDPFETWRLNKIEEAHVGLLKYLRGDPKLSGVLVDPRLSVRSTDPDDATKNRFLTSYWLNYNQTVRLELTFYIKNAHLLSKTNFKKQKLSQIQLNVDNGNGKLVQLDTERIEIAKYAAVKFVIHIKLKRNSTLLKQTTPGSGLIPVPLTFHFISAFGRCFDLEHWGMVGESIATTVYAGCQPAMDILFNWNATLRSLRFRHAGQFYGSKEHCHDEEFVCFFAREPITFHFDVLDMAKQRYVPFTGKYKLRIVGGGPTKDKIKNYLPEEIEAYNVPGRSDVSLIWNLAMVEEDEQHVTKFEDLGKDPDTAEVMLQSGLSRIKWVCNSLSPCARIVPRSILFKTIFYFKIQITNEGVDPETLCNHQREFTIMLYGFPPSPEILLLTTFIFCGLLALYMYIMYRCCRRNKKVWRATKLKLTAWVKIVIDTFPKPLKTKAETVDDQARKDSILLSLQGHLKVPELIYRKRVDKDLPPPSVETVSARSSSSSIGSRFSDEVLPEVAARRAAATWTDMVYEQIISRRLISIVERNKRMRQEILQKATANQMENLAGEIVTRSSTASVRPEKKENPSGKDELEKADTKQGKKPKDKAKKK